MSDPFAQAQVSQGQATASTTPATSGPADPFTGTADMADPFATSDTYRGGDFTPSATLESLQGRLVAMFPRELDPNAKDPNNPGKTREQYTVDLYVLDGGRLSYYYTQKGNPEAQDPADRQDQVKEYVVEDISPTNPFHIASYWVPQGGVIGKLKKAHADGVPFLGIPTMVPVKADRGTKTNAQVKAEVDAWVARQRQGARPRYSWSLEAPDAGRRQGAIQWWAAAKDSVDPIDRAKAPKRNA
jgi:hypothetical protein